MLAVLITLMTCHLLLLFGVIGLRLKIERLERRIESTTYHGSPSTDAIRQFVKAYKDGFWLVEEGENNVIEWLERISTMKREVG